MSTNKFSDVREGPPFGQKLDTLRESKKYKSAAEIAAALYENDLCFDLVHPGGRFVKYLTYREKDINTIARRVQEHILPTVEVYDIPSNYILAYSILFNCSLDFLYGKINDPYPNLEIADICQKTGLSSKAVMNLTKNSKIYLDNFMIQYFEDEFLYSNIDEEAHIDVNKFWSDLLESDFFIKLPESWGEMACALQLFKAIHEQFLEEDTKEPSLPSRDDFFNIVDEYFATHDETSPYLDKALYEIYDHDKDQAMALIRDINNCNRQELSSDSTKAQMVYWGCAGMFDRLIENYFHDLADKYEIPTYDPYERSDEIQ